MIDLTASIQYANLYKPVYVLPAGKSAVMCETMTTIDLGHIKKNCNSIELFENLIRCETVYGVTVLIPLHGVKSMIPLEAPAKSGKSR